MSTEIMNIILSALGVFVTGLASFAVAKITGWINSKINNAQVANYVSMIGTLVENAVKETYQVFVQSLKEDGNFGAAAQKEALRQSLEHIKLKCTPEIISYITSNFGDVDAYLKGLIEAQIYTLKSLHSSSNGGK